MSSSLTKEIEIFENAEFGAVRTVMVDGIPFFVGKDVADALGYQNGSRDINRHVDKEDRCKSMVFDGNQNKETILINESGLYSLIMGSKLPTAKRFKHWVTSEVLPSIRKHGTYMTDDIVERTLTDPDYLIKLATKLKEERQARYEAEQKNVMLNKENNLLAKREDEWDDKKIINALVRRYAVSLRGDYAKAWNDYKKSLLYKYSINLNARVTHYLKSTGKKAKPKLLDMFKECELPQAKSLITAMCRNNNIDIIEVLKHEAS